MPDGDAAVEPAGVAPGAAGVEPSAPSTPGTAGLEGSFASYATSAGDGGPKRVARRATRGAGRRTVIGGRGAGRTQSNVSEASSPPVEDPPPTPTPSASSAGGSPSMSLRSRVGLASPNFTTFSKRAGGLFQAAARTAEKGFDRISTSGGDGRGAERVIRLTKSAPTEALGMVLDHISLVVKSVDAGGPAARAGFEAGMRVTAAAGSRVTSFEELRSAVSGCGGLTIDFAIAAERVAIWETVKVETLEELGDGKVALSAEEWRSLHGELNGLRKVAAEAALHRKEIEPLRHRAQHLAKVADEKSQECKRLSELVAKSKAAGEVEQLEALLRQREEQSQEVVESFKQAQAALKVSLRDLRSQNESLRSRLGESADCATPSATFTTGSAEDMQRAVEAEKLQERVAELEAELEKTRRQAEAFHATVDKLQEDLKQQDRDTRTAKRECDDIRAENGMLHDELKRLSRQVQEMADEREEIVSTMMNKVKSVGHDKDGHLREASGLLIKVQEECEEFRRKLAASERECESLTKAVKAAEQDAQKARTQEGETRTRTAALEREMEELKNAKRELQDARLGEKAARIAELEEAEQSLKDEVRRITNLHVELTAALEKSEDAAEGLRSQVEEDAERLAALEGVQSRCEGLAEELQAEHGAALDLADEVDALEARAAAAESSAREARTRAAALEGDLAGAKGEVAQGLAAMERLREDHLAELGDKETENRLSLRRQAAKLRDLQHQLKEAQARGDMLSRLEGHLRHRGQQMASPSSAQQAASPLGFQSGATDTSAEAELAEGAPTYLDLSEQNSHLLDRVSSLQERLWASDQCKKALQEDLVRKQQELSKRGTVLSALLQGQSPDGADASPQRPGRSKGMLNRLKDAAAGGVASGMQGVIEDMMFENIRLRDANAKLQREMAAESGR